jgi:hypothetical protein
LGVPGYLQGCGRRVTSAVRISGNVLLGLDMHGLRCIYPQNLWGHDKRHRLPGLQENWSQQLQDYSTIHVMGDKIRIDVWNYGERFWIDYQTNCAQNGALPAYSDCDPCSSGYGYPLTPLPDAILTNYAIQRRAAIIRRWGWSVFFSRWWWPTIIGACQR